MGLKLSVVLGFVVAVVIVIWFTMNRHVPVAVVAMSLPSEEAKFQAAATVLVPERNKAILNYVNKKGRSLAPDYHSVVCTEYIIKVIEDFQPLTKRSKRDIRIITDEDLSVLVEREDDIIKGVQTAFARNNIGSSILNFKEVSPGDFVQFWNTDFSFSWGHCGIVSEIVPGESITMYSSHPVTDGYGIHKFSWPDKVFFARLN